jgi:hypothetical protein
LQSGQLIIDFIISHLDKNFPDWYDLSMAYMGDKIEEELEKMEARRNGIWNDLKSHSEVLSAATQVALIGEIASIDVHIKDMRRQLEDMGWHKFIQAAWSADG